jgi:hypothetical protein
MGNKEPKPKKTFWLELGNKRIICTPDNTKAYLFEDPTFDHLFHITSVENNGNMNGFYIFRPMLGDEAFDNLVRHMIHHEFEVESLTEPDANDKQVYISKYGEPQPPLKMLESHDITPRQEHIVEFMHYLLENEKLAIEDFDGEGEVII